jgi:hypothetical protein
MEAIEIKVVEKEKADLVTDAKTGADYQKKILIQANRLINVKGNPIKVSSVPKSYLLAKQNQIFTEEDFDLQQRLQQGRNLSPLPLPYMISILSNKIYNANKDVIVVSKLRIRHLEISRNEILKNYGCGIKLFEVRSDKNDPFKILLRQNSISESYVGGGGIVVENSSCTLKDNELRKNIQDGIFITSNCSLVSQLNQSAALQPSAGNNYQYLSYVVIKNCQVQENTGNGL